MKFILGKALEGIPKVKEQKESSTKHGDLDTSPATFGVVKRARDNDLELHSNQQVCMEDLEVASMQISCSRLSAGSREE